jgi:hypothetical protein
MEEWKQMTYNLNQAGDPTTFSTGAKRDTQEGKSRLDLISPIFLDRLGVLLAKGAAHYGERNWEKGMNLSRIQASCMRHIVQWLDGQDDEDHAIQAAFNLMAFVHTEHCIRTGALPAELDDIRRPKNLSRKLLTSGDESAIKQRRVDDPLLKPTCVLREAPDDLRRK